MYNTILEKIKNKNIAILGFGKEGISTYKFIRKYLSNQNITIIDKNINLKENNKFLNEDKNITYVLGDNYLDNLNIYDLIIKSPGIKIFNDTLREIEDKITSQIEIALELYRNNIIGITGTKGKSTTSSLLYKILKDQNIDCLLLGNVGNPIFDYIEDIKKDTILVIEMSSYQLDLVKYSPHIGIILNLFEDHLNYHITKKEYHYAKLNIFKYQTDKDYALYTSSNKNILKYIKTNNYKAKFIDINKEFKFINDDIYYKNIKIYNKNAKRLLIGEHNLSNILFILKLAIMLKLDINKTIKSIEEFKPLEHRMEYIGKYNGIDYYNDSIATIPEATINCLETYKDIDTLIFGGLDRGIDYTSFIDYLNNSNINNFICMPETAHRLSEFLKKGNIYKVETLEEAVEIAKNVTKKSCLLSPAAPSYNAFKNFEEKGKKYKELVTNNENK